MKKLVTLVSLLVIGISLIYITLPHHVKAFVDVKLLKKEAEEKVKTMQGQISSYVEVYPTITLPPEKETDAFAREVGQENEEVEFKEAEDQSEIITYESDSVSGNSIEDFIIGQINSYRAKHGLGSVSMDSATCDFAVTRAGEIKSNFSHDGFRSRINSNSLPYSSYSKVTENIAMHYDYKLVVESWENSPGHAENMRADTPFVCVKKNGDYYAYEGWKP